MAELTDRMVGELVDAVRQVLRKESQERLRDVYLVGDIEKDIARSCIERLRELANDGNRPITLYINSAGGNVTDGLAIHDAIRHLVSLGVPITIVVQGMASSMGSVVLQAASPGRRFAFPHSWMMIHEPAKWAGWQSTTAAAQHLDRLKQMQSQIYQILSERSGRPLRQIIRDTKRTDFYLDAQKAKEFGLIDEVLGPADKALGVEDAAVLAGSNDQVGSAPPSQHPTELSPAEAASEPQPPPSDAIVNVLSGKRMSRKE
jgi:ATP-dependent Clp protease protease subunit